MKTTRVTAKQVPRDENCALDNNIIAKKIIMKSHLELGNEHERKLKPVIKQFDTVYRKKQLNIAQFTIIQRKIQTLIITITVSSNVIGA